MPISFDRPVLHSITLQECYFLQQWPFENVSTSMKFIQIKLVDVDNTQFEQETVLGQNNVKRLRICCIIADLTFIS